MTVRPSYKTFGYGVFIKDKLVQAGPRGLVPADLWKTLKENWESLEFLRFKGDGTYNSFMKYWHNLGLLKYVAPTNRTEPSRQKGGTLELEAPRTYFRITAIGRRAGDAKWSNPLIVLHPEAAASEKLEYYREYLTGWRKKRRAKLIALGIPVRKRGRPRLVKVVPPPVVKPPPKPPKPPEVIIAEKLEAEVKTLAPLIDRLVVEPGLVAELEEKLTELRSRTADIAKEARGKEKERLDTLIVKMSRTIEHLPLIPTALRLPPGARREEVLASSIKALKDDLGL